MPDLPTWISDNGRLVLLGDSAHAMFPDAAQGFSQIVEDIAALSTLLSSHDATSMLEMTRAWEQIRKPRVGRVKDYAHSNHNLYAQGGATFPKQPQTNGVQSQDKCSTVLSVEEDVAPNRDAEFNTPPFIKWLLDYDAAATVLGTTPGI